MKKSRKRSALERYRKDISRCVRCGSCSAVCPSFLADRRESRSPRGRMALIEAVLDGRLEASQVYKDRLATCTGCLACESRCANGVPVADIILAAKEAAVAEAGTSLIERIVGASLRNPSLMRSLAWLAPVALHYSGAAVRGNAPRRTAAARGPLGMRQKERENRTGGRDAKRKRIAFFPGCAIAFFQNDIWLSVDTVVERLGYEMIVPDGLECCGRPFLSLGDRDGAIELAERNAAILGSLDVEAIVTACASCGLTFKHEYPALLASSGVRIPQVMDIHEFLADKLDRLDLAPLQGRVTVHDPCHLGRGQSGTAAMRILIDAVPGLDRAEMQEPGRCCGFGGVMRATHAELSNAIGDSKARDIAGTGATIVLTGCPGCRMQISESLRRNGSDAAVMHTVQVIAEALEEGSRGPGSSRKRFVLLGSGS